MYLQQKGQQTQVAKMKTPTPRSVCFHPPSSWIFSNGLSWSISSLTSERKRDSKIHLKSLTPVICKQGWSKTIPASWMPLIWSVHQKINNDWTHNDKSQKRDESPEYCLELHYLHWVAATTATVRSWHPFSSHLDTNSLKHTHHNWFCNCLSKILQEKVTIQK